MKILATVQSRQGSASKVYEDTDCVFGMLRMSHKDVDTASKAYSRVQAGETVKFNYQGARVYLRKVGA